MKQKFKHIVSLFLAILMLISSTICVTADYDDGGECPWCGHYHWGDYLCGGCGGCSEECTNEECYESIHCPICGMCLALVDCCDTYNFCMDCIESEGLHCSSCGECHCDDWETELCGDCFQCFMCCGFICDECGFCADCAEHCPICYGCRAHIGDCESGGDHCIECCVLCDQCERCITYLEEEEGIEVCLDCDLCQECCLENSEEAGCSCGVCIMSGEWEEHICEECGKPFCEVDQCDTCGLCVDCCEANSDCTEGMCVEDPDYEEHFCSLCGNCFDAVEMCESCYENAGELICVDCCNGLTASEGCDCGDYCLNDPDFEEHMEVEHKDHSSGTGHNAINSKAWSFDESKHWHECVLCDEEAHYGSLGEHHYNEYGECVECGYQKDGAIYIVKSPKNVSCEVTDVNASKDDPLYYKNNLVKFYAKAKGKGTLTYTWYESAYDGKIIHKISDKDTGYRYVKIEESETGDLSTLILSVPTEACNEIFSYYCVITDEYGNSTTTSAGTIKAKHVYTNAVAYHATDAETTTLTLGQSELTVTASSGHQFACCGEGCEKLNKTIVGHSSTSVEVKDAEGNTWKKNTCGVCGYVNYVQQHEHTYAFEDTGAAEYVYNKSAKRYEGKTDDGRTIHINSMFHSITCSFEGCEVMSKENHIWQFSIVSPVTGPDSVGAIYRECLVCGYQQTSFKDADGKEIQWKYGAHPIKVVQGTANRTIAKNGESLRLTYTGDSVNKCIGWECYYKDAKYDIEITQCDNLVWQLTIPDLNDAEILTFKPITETCAHDGGTTLSNVKEAKCVTDGYTGDEICVDCGKLVKEGQTIVAPGKHTGTLTFVEGSGNAGTCTERGYEGDYTCSDCGGKVKGKSLGFNHEINVVNKKEATFLEEGYTGDKYCTKCGKLMSEGSIIPKLDVSDYLYITNQSPFSYTPITDYESGDVITATFDAVLDETLAKAGYTVRTITACYYGKKAIFGELIIGTHSSLEIDTSTFYGDCKVLRMAYLFDPTDNVVGYVSTDTILRISNSTCNHNFKLISDTATCKTAGTKYYECTLCGKCKTVISPKTSNHIFSDKYSCDGTKCWKQCINCGERTDVKEHSYKTIKSVEVSCTEADVTMRCTRCNNVIQKRVDNLNNHVYNDNWSGGYVKDANYHWQYCTKCGAINKQPHDYSEYESMCCICFYQKGEHIGAWKESGEHYIGVPSVTCIHQKVTADTSHISTEILNTYPLVWYVMKEGKQVTLGTGKTIDLSKLSTAQKKIVNCNTLYVSLMNGTTELLCSSVLVQDCAEVAAKPATCATDGWKAHYVCPVCNAKEDANFNIIDPTIKATGKHVYDNDCDTTCNVCGATRKAKHAFNGPIQCDSTGHWRVCLNCGVKGQFGTHDEFLVWKTDSEATCTTQGKKHLECLICDYVVQTQTTSTEHEYVGTTTKSTCEQEGSIIWTCEACGDTVTETLAACGHVISQISEKAATCLADGVKAHYECLICGGTFADAKGETPIDSSELVIPKTDKNHVGFLCYGRDENNHRQLCQCGAALTADEAHTFVDNVCTVCGFKKVELPPEEDDDDEGEDNDDEKPIIDNPDESKRLLWPWILGGVVLVLGAGATVLILVLGKKKKDDDDKDQDSIPGSDEKAE